MHAWRGRTTLPPGRAERTERSWEVTLDGNFTATVVPEGGTSLSKTHKTLEVSLALSSKRPKGLRFTASFDFKTPSAVIQPAQGPGGRSLALPARGGALSPVGAGPGGRAVRGQGGDGGHRQGPGRGGHGEGPHHGPRAAASTVVQAGGLWGEREQQREARWRFATADFRSGGLSVLDHVVLAWKLDPNCQHFHVPYTAPLGVRDVTDGDLVLDNFKRRFLLLLLLFYQDHNQSASSKVTAGSTDPKA